MLRIIIVIFFFSSSCLYGQLKGDYYWAMGHDFGTEAGVQSYSFDFTELPMIPEERIGGLIFRTASASICDSEGNLLFYTNGCKVANKNHEIMINGDSINYNNYYDEWLNGCNDVGYNELQGILILPDPNYDMGYYVIHKPKEKEEGESGFWQEFLKYSYVDLSTQDGLGEVTAKNEVIFNAPLESSYLSAIKHQNGIDWWIICRGDNNNIFYKVLLSKEGFSTHQTQVIGPMPGLDFETISKHGNAKFSPDGNKFAFFNLHDGLSVYDFDRSNGHLSNGRYLDWMPLDEFNWFGSLEFSPNSQYIYLTNSFFLYQLDLLEPNIEDGLVMIDEWDGTNDPFPTTFFVQALGPDCKIYIRPGSSSNVFHTIHQPNKKGKDCEFVQRDVQLPTTSESGSFPNFPRFRVDEENKCDPSITMVNGIKVDWQKELSIYPNPTSNEIYLELPDDIKSAEVQIIDSSGAINRRIDISGQSNNRIDVSMLKSGFYFVELRPSKGNRNLIYKSSMIKIE